jgi:hypothetical protein
MNLAVWPLRGRPVSSPVQTIGRTCAVPCFWPMAPSCFRLEGPDALPDAPARFARDAAAFGAIASNDLTDREQKYWSLVQNAWRTS